MKVLVTGGAGFIGSHTLVELLRAGHAAVVVDNYVNSSEESLRRVEAITGKTLVSEKADLVDRDALERVFQTHTFDAVIHFAGLKAVGESVEVPLKYYHNNIIGTLNLLELMKQYHVRNIVFSSSATVYGVPERLPLDEACRTGPTNPYGRTKLFIEEIIHDVCIADSTWNAVMLRYFNPVGAHKSGRIGEDPQGIPNNLMPFVAQVAVGRRPKVMVFGSDYNTPDGTGVRDYIHVTDLANGHVAALDRFAENHGFEVFNLGTGNGYSVLDMIAAMKKASGRDIPYEITARRPGDVDSVFANPSAANEKLRWKATLGLEEMCEDLWRWQQGNPNGFEDAAGQHH